jgi:hypothetical protein
VREYIKLAKEIEEIKTKANDKGRIKVFERADKLKDKN